MENTQKDLIPAFGYLRVSGENQVDGDGFPRQRVAIEKWAAENGVTIVRWFEEKAVSGTVESIDRPAFNDMLEALLSNGTHTVVIERLDRIARDVFIQEGTIRLLNARGFTLVSAAEPNLCGDDMYRVAMRQMMGVFAELDRKSIVFKLKAARQRKRAVTGHCEGRKLYGQHKDTAVAQAEQSVIARITAMHASGSNYEQIAKTLNAEGIAARKGSWFGSTVRNVIKRAQVNAQLDWLQPQA